MRLAQLRFTNQSLSSVPVADLWRARLDENHGNVIVRRSLGLRNTFFSRIMAAGDPKKQTDLSEW